MTGTKKRLFVVDISRESKLAPRIVRRLADEGRISSHRDSNGWRVFTDKSVNEAKRLVLFLTAPKLLEALQRVRAMLHEWHEDAVMYALVRDRWRRLGGEVKAMDALLELATSTEGLGRGEGE